MWHEQAIIEWSWCVISIVACCHNVKLCTLAAQVFRSQQNGAVTNMRCVIGTVHCKMEVMFLQPLRWHCIECVIHHDGICVKNNTHIYVAWTSNNRLIMPCDLYCCLLPQCEALCTYCPGFPIATVTIDCKWTTKVYYYGRHCLLGSKASNFVHIRHQVWSHVDMLLESIGFL